MSSEVVFRPARLEPSYYWQIAAMGTVFFLVVQVAFLEGMAMRLVFTGFFAVFALVGVYFSLRTARTWPQEVRMNDQGISYTDLAARHGIEHVPWTEIENMDLFYEQQNMAPFLRLGLRNGRFRESVRKTFLLRISRGLDVNIPVAVDAEPEVVLATAMRFWRGK